MNFLIDVHLPISLSKFLDKRESCRATHVNQILSRWNSPDGDICKYADENNLVVVTKDSDFKNSHFINNTPKRVIRVVLGNISNVELISLFEKHLPFITPFRSKSKFYIEIGREQLMIID